MGRNNCTWTGNSYHPKAGREALVLYDRLGHETDHAYVVLTGTQTIDGSR
jgi:hypothetical protein